MTKNSLTCALIALLILTLSGCASQGTICRRDPLKDSPAPPPEIFSQCLREIVAQGQNKAPISSRCSTFLQHELTK